MSTYELTELSNGILTESLAYDIAYPKMGFIMVRHVNSKMTDHYWKECYTCIRKFYNDPILIIDDSSNPEYLHDNMNLINCQIIYDKDHKGCAELLGYYYFYMMKPFEYAIIIHDSVFIQKKIDFLRDVQQTRTYQPLWTFTRMWDGEIESYYHELCKDMPIYEPLMKCYGLGGWEGCFGVMSVIHCDFIETLHDAGLFTMLDKIHSRRDARSAIERIIGFISYYHGAIPPSMFGKIHDYMKWETTFFEYMTGSYDQPLVKVWTGR
jgi:hypothetical protein